MSRLSHLLSLGRSPPPLYPFLPRSLALPPIDPLTVLFHSTRVTVTYNLFKPGLKLEGMKKHYSLGVEERHARSFTCSPSRFATDKRRPAAEIGSDQCAARGCSASVKLELEIHAYSRSQDLGCVRHVTTMQSEHEVRAIEQGHGQGGYIRAEDAEGDRIWSRSGCRRWPWTARGCHWRSRGGGVCPSDSLCATPSVRAPSPTFQIILGAQQTSGASAYSAEWRPTGGTEPLSAGGTAQSTVS